ncbi:MAG: phosphoethanolamine--lipid A transferase [Pseudoxanthomonas sp.]
MTWRSWRGRASTEQVIALVSLGFTLLCNGPFWHAALSASHAGVRLVLSLLLIVTGLHALLISLVATRRTLRPLLTIVIPLTALAAWFMQSYGLYVDADMLRNVLHTDRREAGELLTPGLLMPLVPALLVVVLLWRVDLVARPSWRHAVLLRALFVGACLLAIAAGGALSSRALASLIRGQREVRYLVTPANYLVSLGRVLSDARRGGQTRRLPIGADAHLSPAARQAGRKPRLLVLVVGETVRAQNWGLNGVTRQTTPELAARHDVLNFPDMHACGSSTEVSLPCMFSPYGRADYDEAKIRAHQSLLHVLARVGVHVLWRDNQSGCKGVCDGLAVQSLTSSRDPVLCNALRCQDGILLKGLEDTLDPAHGDQVIVLHQLGNHGPNYFERSPKAFARFMPTCMHPDLGACRREEIVNAYDNAVSYTDHVLNAAIGWLQARHDYDTALLYVSDHGESLGEKGLFLHGMPYAIAPEEQLRVPMVMWFSQQWLDHDGLHLDCMRTRASQPASHDNLFSTVLGLMQVKTGLYLRERDLLAQCRA